MHASILLNTEENKNANAEFARLNLHRFDKTPFSQMLSWKKVVCEAKELALRVVAPDQRIYLMF